LSEGDFRSAIPHSLADRRPAGSQIATALPPEPDEFADDVAELHVIDVGGAVPSGDPAQHVPIGLLVQPKLFFGHVDFGDQASSRHSATSR
jgi:hypothetical protein